MQREQDVSHLLYLHNTLIGLCRVNVNRRYLGLGPPGKRIVLIRRFKGVFSATESRNYGSPICGIYCHRLAPGSVTGREDDPYAIHNLLAELDMITALAGCASREEITRDLLVSA